MKLKTNNKIRGLLLILTTIIILISCDDVFHNANKVLLDYQEGQGYDNPPKRIFVGGSFTYNFNGKERYSLAVLTDHGNIEGNFLGSINHGLKIGSHPNPGVRVIKISDQYIYVGGNFNGYDSSGDNISIDTDFNLLQRYFRNGPLDITYKPGVGIALNSEVNDLVTMSDRTVYVAGQFTSWFGTNHILRINEVGDGAITLPFDTTTNSTKITTFGTILNRTKLIFGGSFSDFGGQLGYKNLAEIELATNNLENSSAIDPGTAPYSVLDIKEQNNILFISGESTNITGLLKKININGSTKTFDTAFNAAFASQVSSGVFERVNTVAIDDKNRIYIGGKFSAINDNMGYTHENILRITDDGNIDPFFKVKVNGPATPEVHTIEIQKNGDVLIGGKFSDINGESGFNGLVRVSELGQIDFSFDRNSLNGLPDTNIIYTIAIEEET